MIFNYSPFVRNSLSPKWIIPFIPFLFTKGVRDMTYFR